MSAHVTSNKYYSHAIIMFEQVLSHSSLMYTFLSPFILEGLIVGVQCLKNGDLWNHNWNKLKHWSNIVSEWFQ